MNMEGNTIMEAHYDKYSEIDKITEMFYNVGCSSEDAKSFIANNYDKITNTPNITNYLYFILNNVEVYGVILVIDDSYKWSLYKDEEFKPFKEISYDENNEALTNGDYIVEMMINFAEQEKVRAIIPDIEKYNLEDKIKTLKNIGLNSNGYHFK